MLMQRVDGVVLLNKPLHQSSNKVLQTVKRLFHAKKAGHTGSLDPLASGMLPICFGDATKFCQFMLDADKGYTATGKLGTITATQDAEGEVLAVKSVDHITKAHLCEALRKFTGPLKQVPSMYSALKKEGVPLYKLARQGIEVERKARDIIIHELELVSFDLPFFTVRVRCSKGTYIRNLIEDIGNHLNVGAFVSKLHRDYSCPFEGEKMVSLKELEQTTNVSSFLYPIRSMVSHFPVLTVSARQQEVLYYGVAIEVEETIQSTMLYQLVNDSGDFFGLGQHDGINRVKVKRLVQK